MSPEAEAMIAAAKAHRDMYTVSNRDGDGAFAAENIAYRKDKLRREPAFIAFYKIMMPMRAALADFETHMLYGRVDRAADAIEAFGESLAQMQAFLIGKSDGQGT